MERIPVVSNRIRSIGIENNSIEIELNNGVVRQYRHVPDVVCRIMAHTPFIDRWYKRRIKDRYPYTQIIPF